jgi:hypothetical protein
MVERQTLNLVIVVRFHAPLYRFVLVLAARDAGLDGFIPPGRTGSGFFGA